MEWVRLGLELTMKLGEIIVGALVRGQDDVLDQRVSDLLGAELRTSIARRAAEIRAAERFARSEDDTREIAR